MEAHHKGLEKVLKPLFAQGQVQQKNPTFSCDLKLKWDCVAGCSEGAAIEIGRNDQYPTKNRRTRFALL